MTKSKINIVPKDYLVLICDDEEAIRSMLGEAVGNWGFQVATAPNGEAAMEYINAGNIPHIILSDIRMGGMTGIDLAEKAKSLSSEIEVIIMTSHGTFETAVQAMRIGVFDYISKPFDNIEDVKTTLVHVCERIYLRYYNEFLVDELQKKNAEIEKLAALSRELSESLDLNKTIEIGTRGLSEALSKAPTIFFQFNPSQRAFIAVTHCPAAIFGGTQVKMLVPESVGAQQSDIVEFMKALPENPDFKALVLQASEMSPHEMQWKEDDKSPFLIRSFVTRGIPRGFFLSFPKRWVESEMSSLVERYLQTMLTAFENALLHAKVTQTAIRDSLTGLFNVRHFKERFATVVHEASRLGHPVSLLFLDVDHFKKCNDTHGHPAGDQILRMVAELMRKSFRSTDILARYGGEEFVVLMPHTSFVDALEKAEQFRELIEKSHFPNEETQPLGKLTTSIGVSEFPSHGSTMDMVIKSADDALYVAKQKSRNMVAPGVAPEGYVPEFTSKPIRTRHAASTH